MADKVNASLIHTTTTMPLPRLSEEDIEEMTGFRIPSMKMPVIRAEGIEEDSYWCEISNKDYHAERDHVSCSQLKHLLRSPAHYRAALAHKDVDTTAGQDLGTAVHTAILEPHLFASTVVEWKGGIRRGHAWDAFKARHPNATILTPEDMAKVIRMRDAVRDFEMPSAPGYKLGQLIDRGDSEQSIFWRDKETGILCKIRPDNMLLPRATFDLKTVGDSRPEEFLKFQALKLHYDLQVAMYWSGIKACKGFDMPFTFIAVETEEPHGVWLHEVVTDSEFFQNGMAKFQYALRTLKRCRDSGIWPVYEGAHTMMDSIPVYARFIPPDLP